MESKKTEKKLNSEAKSGTVVTKGWCVVNGEMLARVYKVAISLER